MYFATIRFSFYGQSVYLVHICPKKRNDGKTTLKVMGRIQKGEHRGKEFSSDYQPKNRRKPKIFTVLKKEYGVDVSSSVLGDLSREQICDVIKLVLTGDPRNTMILNNKMGQDLKEIQQKLKAGEVPPGIKATDSVWQLYLSLTSAITKETNAGKSDTLRWCIEFLWGKATQPIDNNIIQAQASDDDLSDEDIQAEIDKIDTDLNS
mgnify:CR=1 FL=1